MRVEITAKFSGGLADEHRLPGYAGSHSILGEAHADLIILNYLVEGRVRRRKFKQDDFQFNLVAQQPGSFESVFEFIADPENMALLKNIGLGVGGGVAANFVYELLKHAKRRVVGKDGSGVIYGMEREGRIPSSDIDSLVEAIEPATRESHNVINHGAGGITINVNGDNNIVNFDASTKTYLWKNVIDNNPTTKLMSIANYDANYGGGRAFDYDEGRLVSFETESQIDRRSVELILQSISKYSLRKFEGQNSTIGTSAVAVLFTSVRAMDQRLKKIKMLKVREEISDL